MVEQVVVDIGEVLLVVILNQILWVVVEVREDRKERTRIEGTQFVPKGSRGWQFGL